MNQTILMGNNIALLIPILAISLSLMIPIVAIYFNYRKNQDIMKERELMIREGMTPPPLSDDIPNQKFKNNNLTLRGLNFLAVSLGILSGWLFSESFPDSEPLFSMLAGILFFLGLANVIYGNIIKSNKKEDSQHSNDNK